MASARDGLRMAEATRAIPLRARLPTSRRQIDGDTWTFLVAAAKRDSDNGAALREALRQLEPEVVKKLLLRHARGCTNPKCTTCDKLRTRIDSVKRKRALWRLFRIGAKVAGVLSVKLARAAERVYAPGAAGYQEAQQNFDAVGREMETAALAGNKRVVDAGAEELEVTTERVTKRVCQEAKRENMPEMTTTSMAPDEPVAAVLEQSTEALGSR